MPRSDRNQMTSGQVGHARPRGISRKSCRNCTIEPSSVFAVGSCKIKGKAESGQRINRLLLLVRTQWYGYRLKMCPAGGLRVCPVGGQLPGSSNRNCAMVRSESNEACNGVRGQSSHFNRHPVRGKRRDSTCADQEKSRPPILQNDETGKN